VRHLPSTGKPIPVSTYRVQLRAPDDGHPGFTFDDAAATAPYLAELGVTHLYCSPYLQAAPGSAHGYDVVDHSRLNSELGGSAGFERMLTACRAAGLGVVLDVVPNHMAISEPESQNAAWWSLLREGRQSPYAAWFDIDWTQPVMVPVLGGPLKEVAAELRLEGDRIRYYEHEVPIAEGTLVEGDVLATLERQHYRLCHWTEAGDALNYRRFFDVTTLAGLRVEDPAVFDATHRVILEQVQAGLLDGLRIDHPDGLADPAGYLNTLAEKTGGAWVTVEKILEPGERLPDGWACAGTTGYDALNDILGLFVDPAGERPLTDLWNSVTRDDSAYEDIVEVTKRIVLSDVLGAEVNRLTDVAVAAGVGVERERLRKALVEVLASFGVYRAYLPAPGPADDLARQHVHAATARAVAARPDLTEEIAVVGRLALAEEASGPAAEEFVTRFQQTCGPVMAKGVEDTAFYRYLRLSALNEVGGDPGRFGVSIEAFHGSCGARQADWPLSMTTLSTHDTKRSEDVRARLVLLSECPNEWADAVIRWSQMAAPHRCPDGPDPATEQLVWQTLVGAWPLTPDRAVAYLLKATREAKAGTSWLSPDVAFEQAVEGFVRGVLADGGLTDEIAAFVGRLAPGWRVTSLAQKLIQLTVPGVADTYQGTELFDRSLVDPDNRRAVDYDGRLALLRSVGMAADVHLGTDVGGLAKLRVTATALRLRREHPEWFMADATYTPLDAGTRAIAFARSGSVVVVAPIRALDLEQHGWGDDVMDLPPGTWHNLLTGSSESGTVRLRDLLSTFPVALLHRVGAA